MYDEKKLGSTKIKQREKANASDTVGRPRDHPRSHSGLLQWTPPPPPPPPRAPHLPFGHGDRGLDTGASSRRAPVLGRWYRGTLSDTPRTPLALIGTRDGDAGTHIQYGYYR